MSLGMAAMAAIPIIYITLLVVSAKRNRKKKTIGTSVEHIWTDREHSFMGYPLSFTKYSLDKERLFVNRGFFIKTEDEVRLYRILDIKMKQNVIQQALGLGSIVIKSSDKSLGNYLIRDIAPPHEVKELISETVEEQRKKNRVTSREFMGYDDSEDDSI